MQVFDVYCFLNNIFFKAVLTDSVYIPETTSFQCMGIRPGAVLLIFHFSWI